VSDHHDLRVGLISMPWMSPSIPSIQLATLAAALNREGIAADTHELFLDYAATIGVDLYNKLSDAGRFINEYIFAKQYFLEETGNDLREFRDHRHRFGLASRELEDRALDALGFVTDDFLHDVVTSIDWSKYDAIGFSLTISQTASSMALARLIKLRFPELPIIFGGSSCAGPMGTAQLRICPYVDVVVRVEGELLLPELVQRLVSGESLASIKGISFRAQDRSVVTTCAESPISDFDRQQPLDFDAYFERKKKLGLDGSVETWLPFESSRGCWYGEKQQCTFCGLHEIMASRGRNWKSVLSELEHWSGKYGVKRFFSVDLIMPLNFYDTLLPEIARRGYDWSLFYEIKANVKRAHVEKLAAGGVRWIQPGIESLNTEILKLMKKGVSAIQNIQMLKWSAEFGIRVTWNVITGIPGEDPDAYLQMKQIMPLLHHLFPPTSASPFQLHRFSPYFDQQELYGLESLGAQTSYQYIFPIPKADLDDLVYRHGYKLNRPQALEIYTRPVVEAISEWQMAFRRHARLALGEVVDGVASILDTRSSATPAVHVLTAAEYAFYRFLDEAKPATTLWHSFSRSCPEAAEEIEDSGGHEELLEKWNRSGLTLAIDGKVLALAVRYSQEALRHHDMHASLASPVPYLDPPEAK
jgi:ribosomal peptide maturation radical SAM protein 1